MLSMQIQCIHLITLKIISLFFEKVKNFYGMGKNAG